MALVYPVFFPLPPGNSYSLVLVLARLPITYPTSRHSYGHLVCLVDPSIHPLATVSVPEPRHGHGTKARARGSILTVLCIDAGRLSFLCPLGLLRWNSIGLESSVAIPHLSQPYPPKPRAKSPPAVITVRADVYGAVSRCQSLL